MSIRPAEAIGEQFNTWTIKKVVGMFMHMITAILLLIDAYRSRR